METRNRFLSFMQQNQMQSSSSSVLAHLQLSSYCSQAHLAMNFTKEVLPWFILEEKQNLFFLESKKFSSPWFTKQLGLVHTWLRWYRTMPLIQQSSLMLSELFSSLLNRKQFFLMGLTLSMELPFFLMLVHTQQESRLRKQKKHPDNIRFRLGANLSSIMDRKASQRLPIDMAQKILSRNSRKICELVCRQIRYPNKKQQTNKPAKISNEMISSTMSAVREQSITQQPTQLMLQPRITESFHISKYYIFLQHKQSFLNVQFCPKKLTAMLTAAAMVNMRVTRGSRIRKKAARATLMSIMQRSTGNSLLPTQHSKYLYPSTSSLLLNTSDRTLSSDSIVHRVYAIDYMPVTMKGESSRRESVLPNTRPALSAQKSIVCTTRNTWKTNDTEATQGDVVMGNQSNQYTSDSDSGKASLLLCQDDDSEGYSQLLSLPYFSMLFWAVYNIQIWPFCLLCYAKERLSAGQLLCAGQQYLKINKMKIDKFGYEYSQKKLLGKGTYGAVYLCQRIGEIAPTPFNDFFYDKQLSKSKYCAIKSFFEDLSNNQGLSCSTLREVNFMLINNHKNIVSSHECFFKRERVQLVMDFLLDLQEIVHEQTIKTDELNRKLICYQITNGLAHLHRNYIIHRDLKPQNIFISREGVVKIGDFGMSKEFGTPNRRFTSYVCSKQYRAPELFLRTNFYTQKTDIWSLGCIFYYVYTGQSLFVTDNNTDLAMIIKIFSITGTPSQENWLGYKQLPKYYEFLPFPKKDLAKEKGLSEDVAALIEMCLSLDPKKRPTAEQLLNNPFFQDFRGMEDLYALEIENIYDKKLQNCLNNA